MIRLGLPTEAFNAVTNGRQTALALRGLVVETGNVFLLYPEDTDKTGDTRETYVIVKHVFAYDQAYIASITVSVLSTKGSSQRMRAVTIKD